MSQLKPAAAPDTVVVMKAFIAMPFMLSALPALKPNQPNNNKPAPIIVIGMLCGRTESLFVLFPTKIAATSADIPALT